MRHILPDTQLDRAQQNAEGVVYFLSLKRALGEKFSDVDIFIYLIACLEFRIALRDRPIFGQMLRDAILRNMTPELNEFLLSSIKVLKDGLPHRATRSSRIYKIPTDITELHKYLLQGLLEAKELF